MRKRSNLYPGKDHAGGTIRGFTLIELLVVVSIIALLLAVLLPGLGRARQQAKIVAVHAELAQIGLALEMYMDDQQGKSPPTRQDCALGWEDHQLPPELVAGKYLPDAPGHSGMSAGMEDRFKAGVTYKYWSVGELYQNGRYMPFIKAGLSVPRGFPELNGAVEEDIYYTERSESPVSWIIYSSGLNYDEWETLKVLNGPVARRCWYDVSRQKGILTRVRLKKGRHVGTFE